MAAADKLLNGHRAKLRGAFVVCHSSLPGAGPCMVEGSEFELLWEVGKALDEGRAAFAL
jgi:hypothetical protein